MKFPTRTEVAVTKTIYYELIESGSLEPVEEDESVVQ